MHTRPVALGISGAVGGLHEGPPLVVEDPHNIMAGDAVSSGVAENTPEDLVPSRAGGW